MNVTCVFNVRINPFSYIESPVVSSTTFTLYAETPETPSHEHRPGSQLSARFSTASGNGQLIGVGVGVGVRVGVDVGVGVLVGVIGGVDVGVTPGGSVGVAVGVSVGVGVLVSVGVEVSVGVVVGVISQRASLKQ